MNERVALAAATVLLVAVAPRGAPAQFAARKGSPAQQQQQYPACRPCPAPAPIDWAVVTQYRYYPGVGVYRLHTPGATWQEARAACEAEGTQLALANSQAEADLFKKLYSEAGIDDWFFVGFSRGTNGRFYTVQGRPLESAGYVKWSANEPDNMQGNEDCGLMRPNGLLADGWCGARLSFVCEAPL